MSDLSCSGCKNWPLGECSGNDRSKKSKFLRPKRRIYSKTLYDVWYVLICEDRRRRVMIQMNVTWFTPGITYIYNHK